MRINLIQQLTSAACALAMLLSSAGSTLLPIQEIAVQAAGSAETETTAEGELCHQSIELHPGGEETKQVITLDGLMPEGATAEAVDVSDAYDGIAAYDITISDGGSEYQPGEDHPILVEITDPEIPRDGDVTLLHIRDDGSREEITDFTLVGDRIRFYAEAFSVYAIVQEENVVLSDEGWQKVSSLQELSELGSSGLYIGNTGGYYFMNTTTGDTSRMGITKTVPAAENPGGDAALYYFEQIAETAQYYVYCYSGSEKQYLYNSSDNSLSLTSEENKTAFTAEFDSSKGFRFHNGAWYWNMQGGVSGTRFCSYNKATDGNNYLNLWHYQAISDDPYKLNGKTYGLMNFTGGTHGYALMADREGNNVHTLIELVIRRKAADEVGATLYVDEGDEVTSWTFHSTGADLYNLSANTADGVKYLAADASGLYLADAADAASFQITADNNGRIRLCAGGNYVGFSMSDDGQNSTSSFSMSPLAGDNTWLYLIGFTELDDTDYITYSADRISVSNVADGQKVIIYTRLWDEINKRYDMYAVDFNGTLYPCYARGGKILWLGDGTGSLEWVFTEYLDEVTKQPNYYYELYNPYSEMYIAPQITSNQILAENPIGINMQGRRNGDFYSEITAWDNPHYAYIGMKPNEDKTKLIPCSQSTCVPFYFATLEPLNLSDRLHEVPTIDNNEHGITIKMQDFDSRDTMSGFLGSNTGGAVQTTVDNLLSTSLGADGYPTVTKSGKSLSELYDDPTTVNHLFIQSVYNSSGYFEFDSCQNFATLCEDDGTLKDTYNYTDPKGKVIPTIDFTVYRELGTSDNDTGCTRKHGQFFPYDNIVGKPISTHKNTYSSLTDPKGSFGELPESDPRKYEQMYNVGSNRDSNKSSNYYNGMELEASFVQTASGLDAWGHDIIFEFTGDDDFWLYVDDELVIDLGGIHSALQANVNFRTGKVQVNKKNKTLKQIFIDNFKTRYKQEHGGAEPSADAISTYLLEYFQPDETKPYGVEEIFADYSTHKMRIFYMERGAGASNLHMRFNIASVTPGHVVVSKTISGEGADLLDTDFLEYPFQIYYTVDMNSNGTIEDDEEMLLGNKEDYIHVTYQNSNQPVTFLRKYRPPGVADEDAYENIYFINPAKNAEISFPDGTIGYRLVECAVDSTVYGRVLINGEEVEGVKNKSNQNLISYSSSLDTAEEKPRISFDNYVQDNVIKDLYITKKLLDENDREVTDDPATFSFRLSLSSVDVSADELQLANMYKYYVLSPNRKMCRFQADGMTFAETSLSYSYDVIKALHKAPVDGVSADDVTFTTSGFGAISGIPSGYTIVVPGLPVGTIFKVTEDVKTGYGLVGYERVMGEKVKEDHSTEAIASYREFDGNPLNMGVVIAEENPQMIVKNKKGYGLTVKKKWSDLSITTSHAPVYTAVYVDGKLLEGSVRQIKAPATSAYYFWTTLEPLADGRERTDLGGYAVKEVRISAAAPTVDADGKVTNYGTLTPLEDGSSLSLTATRTAAATPGNEEREKEYEYVVSYDVGAAEGLTRTDTITNTRKGGAAIRLFKWDSNVPLKDGIFSLTDSSGKLLGTYSSDADGIVTMLYGFEMETPYTLTQTAAPKGYVGLQKPVCFIIHENETISLFYQDGVTPWGQTEQKDQRWVNSKPGGGGIVGYVDVYNKQFNFKIAKMDGEDTGIELGGAHFALYKQENTSISGYVKNKEPMAGFEDMVTVDGMVDVCGGSSGRTIKLGTKDAVFFLTEIEAPFNYTKLEEDIIFKITPIGVPRLISDSYNGQLIETEDSYIYTLSVPNVKEDPDLQLLTIEKQVDGAFGDKSKAFAFTVTISGADGDDTFVWAKNGEKQPNMAHDGGTFTMKHHDRVEIALPSGVTVTVKEDSDGYESTFRLDDGAAETVSEMTFPFTDSAVLLVTNTLDGTLPLGSDTQSMERRTITLIALPLIPLLCILYYGCRRRKDE